jgi:predicted MPP superfamily phosphohydrolase
MARNDKRFLVAQVSDLHCGDLRFDHKLMSNCVEIINEEDPDLVVVVGDPGPHPPGVHAGARHRPSISST